MNDIDPLLLRALAASSESDVLAMLREGAGPRAPRPAASSSMAFRLAGSSARPASLALLLDQLGFDPNAIGPDGLDAASWCAAESHWPGACAILALPGFEPSAERLGARSRHGMGLASGAAALGQAASLRRLLAARPGLALAADDKGADAFWHACEGGNPRCAAMLAPLTDPSALYPDGAGPLHMAAKLEDPECCRILLGRGADRSRQDEHGRLALHWAAASGAWRCAVELASPCELSLPDFEGRSPLDLARLSGCPQCLSALESIQEKLWLGEALAAAEGSEEGSGRL